MEAGVGGLQVEEVLSTATESWHMRGGWRGPSAPSHPAVGGGSRDVELARAYAAAVERIDKKVRPGEELEEWDRIMLSVCRPL